jgi:energy-coupling factor transporter transmembrane protein EcfT
MYNLGQYVGRESLVHRLDPRIKIIALMALSIVILQVKDLGLLVAAALIMGASKLARLPGGALVRSLRPVLPFFFCLFLLYIFFTPGRLLPGFPMGPLRISYQGLNLGIIQVGKFLLLVLAASLLTMATTLSEITTGLERLLRPLKIVGISSHNVAMMVSLALRFVPVLGEEMKGISEAQLARGANFNPRRLGGKIRAIGYLAAPLAINIFRRCDDLVEAMEARGYQPGPRTYLREQALTRTDYGILGALLVMVFTVLAWK